MVEKLEFRHNPILLKEQDDHALATEGYAIFPLLGKTEVEALSRYYSEFQKEEPQHFYSSTHSPDFEFRKKTSDFIKSVITPLLPGVLKDYKVLGGAYVVKPAHGKGILQAHQDWNLVDESKARSYNLWIPLVDVNEQNGAVFILPESHAKVPTLRGPNIPSTFKQIEQIIWKHLLPLNMSAGEALLYDHALIHGSPVNQTPTDRLGIVIGIVAHDSDMQMYGMDNGVVKCYECGEDYFLTHDVLSDFVNLPQKGDGIVPVNELSLQEFEAIYLPTKEKLPFPEQVMKTDQRSFFETYTPKNIIAEIKYRLRKTPGPQAIQPTSANKDVAKFYNEQTHNFLKVYGRVIQAFRTKNVNTLLDYQIAAIGLKPGMKVLDAGCGVCGPAIYFAEHAACEVEAITISGVQVDIAKKNIQESTAAARVNVKEGDYHRLENYYPENSFDAIYFLESFGHAHDHAKVLDSAWKVLKPGGVLYIKDLFIKKTFLKDLEKGIEKEIKNINDAYHYNVPDLNAVLDYARKKAYILSSLKTIDIPLEEFENLTISNDFQELTGINKIDNLRDYVFPVDFFELKLMKPSIDVGSGNSRYFLQNLYFMQIENWKESEL